MTEENQNPVAGDGNGKIAHPQKIYIKDASFESPGSPDIFTHEWKPNLEVEIDSHAEMISEQPRQMSKEVRHFSPKFSRREFSCSRDLSPIGCNDCRMSFA